MIALNEPHRVVGLAGIVWKVEHLGAEDTNGEPAVGEDADDTSHLHDACGAETKTQLARGGWRTLDAWWLPQPTK